ncbi:hypothetical protein [Yoonia maritima]|uniref:hypothetical protein n=1 Tax=Yoonia maritima TaxID=1435347 RepID=UPI000D10B269|nr:hypothetical protein [Yoonia maritima]
MIASGDLRAYLRGLSHQVWTDQNDAIQHNFWLQEVTITEMLLLRMARDLSPHGLKMKMFSGKEEGGETKKDGTVVKVGNGADWEWFVELPDCKIGFRVQAKRLFPTPTKQGAYNSFHAGGKQIDQLINAAGKMNPVYVLYNHKFAKDASLFSRSVKTNWYGRSSWGCSVATAAFMKTLKTNKLAEVFPGTVPWHRFFAVGNHSVRGCAVERMMKNMLGGQEFKTRDDRPDWVDDLLSLETPIPSVDEGIEEQPTGRLQDGQPSDADPVSAPDQSYEARRGRLTGLLSERELQGVAYFDFTKFQGD